MSEEAIKLAKKLLESDVNYLDHVTNLSCIGNKLHGQCWNTDFHIFGLVASDLDHLPLSHVRAQCSSDFLAKSDSELAESIEYYRVDITNACNKIIGSKNV